MRSHSLLCVLGAFAGLALAGCASNAGNHRQYEKSTDVAQGDAELMSYRIRTWSVPNDHTVVFESMDGTRYRAETLGPCNGLDFAAKLGFQNRNGFRQVDRFTSVVLPDGTRCSFQDFRKLVSPATKALDSFEKLGGKQTATPAPASTSPQ